MLGCGEIGIFILLMRMFPLWKTVLQFLKKFNIELPYESAIPLFNICPGEMKRHVHTKKVYRNVPRSGICYNWKVETTQMLINGGVDK